MTKTAKRIKNVKASRVGKPMKVAVIRRGRTGRVTKKTSAKGAGKTKVKGDFIIRRDPVTGRAATTKSAKAVDRTILRYSDALKQLAKR